MTSHTNFAASPVPSLYFTPGSSKSNKYSIRDAENSYFYIPPSDFTVSSDKPLTIDARTMVLRDASNSKKIDIEWIAHSSIGALTYLLIAIIAICYYAGCFLHQYGNYTHRSMNDHFDEATLTRVVMVEWLAIVALLISGLLFTRRIFMPLYIFVAIIATFGTAILFIIKFKQFLDSKIEYYDIPLNLLGVLLFFSIIHDVVYFYAMHLHLVKLKLFRDNYYSNIARV